MFTKYNTGQAVLIPAVIRSAREQNGEIVYDVEYESWMGVPESDIIVDDKVSAKVAYDKAMTQLSKDIIY